MSRRPARGRAALAAAALAVATAACSGGEDPDASPSPPFTEITSPAPVEEDANSGNPPLTVPIPDGRYSGVVVRVDAAKRRVVFNPFAWVTGAAAKEIHRAENLDDKAGPPNDFLIVNQTDTLWQAPLAKRVEVRLVQLSKDSDPDLDSATLKQLREYLQSAGGRKLPFWLRVKDKKVISIEEQYTP